MVEFEVHTLDYSNPDQKDVCIEGIQLYFDVMNRDQEFPRGDAEMTYQQVQRRGYQGVQLRGACDDQLIASLGWWEAPKGVAKLERVATAEKFQKQGFGLMLLEATEVELMQRGIYGVWLISSKAGVSLYERAHYQRDTPDVRRFKKQLL